MLLAVKAKDDDDNIIFEGSLNKKEVAFLIQFAVNMLMADGVQFNLGEPSEDEDGAEQLRFNFDDVPGGLN